MPWRREPPVSNLFLFSLQLPITPVFSFIGCDESRQTPIRIKRAAMTLPSPWRPLPPQKNVGAAACPMGLSQTRGCRCSGANPSLAHVAGDPLLLQTGDGGTASHSDQLAVAPVPNPGLPAAVVTHVKQRSASNGFFSFSMWKHARASLCASALIATTLFVLDFSRS